MIGRAEEIRPFELIRWARQQAAAHELRTLEAHVLLLLATYANKEGVAWPSIKTLAIDSGLRPTKDGRNSAVSAALQRLEDERLIWTKQGGHGHSARRELLFRPASQPSAQPEGTAPAAAAQPSAQPEGTTAVPTPQPGAVQDGSLAPQAPQPSAGPEGSELVDEGQPSGLADVQPSGLPDQKCQGNGQPQLPEATARGSRPESRKASRPARRTADVRPLGDVLAERLGFGAETAA